MLSKTTEVLPSVNDFIYEIKMDGQRTIAQIHRKNVLLYTRNGQNVTDKYPELGPALQECSKKTATLDGEIIALKEGIPSFELLQQRMNLRDMRAIRRAMEEVPVVYYVFDILEYGGKSLLKMSLIDRKQILQQAVTTCDQLKILPYFDSRDFILQKAREFGYEGVVAKRKNSFYYPGQRTDAWLKFKFQNTDSFVIGGWVEGGRSFRFGSILIGKFDGKKLVHCGRAGTGFDEKQIALLMGKFERLASNTCPFLKVPRTAEKLHWLKPKLVAEVRFKEWTRAGIVRAPVFIALRDDLTPVDCKL